MSKKAYVKVFRKPRRVLLLTTVKNAGIFELKDDLGRLVLKRDGGAEDPRLIRLRSVRTLSLGQKSKHSIVIVTFRYSNANGQFPGDDEADIESDFFGIVARLTVTITNKPPATAVEEELPINESDPNPEEEEDAPEG